MGSLSVVSYLWFLGSLSVFVAIAIYLTFVGLIILVSALLLVLGLVYASLWNS